MKKESSDNELFEYNDLVQKLGSVTRAPKLSRSQKKRMLHTAMGTESVWLRVRPFALTFAVLLLVATSVLTFVSKPGDTLYALKRTVEDVRSIVQPSYDDTLIKRRQDEIEKLRNSGAGDDDIQKAESEKLKIEERRSGKKNSSGESNDSNTSIDDSAEDSEAEFEDNSRNTDSKDETESGRHSSSENTESDDSASDNSSSDDSAEQTEQTTSARDVCRSALYSRKKNGEKVDSDEYKICD